MAQVSFRWKQIPYPIAPTTLKDLQGILFTCLSQKRIYPLSRWLVVGFGLVILLAWNWKLILATGAGIGLMWFVYLLQGMHWQVFYTQWQHFFSSSNGKLTLAVGSGGFASLVTYVAASVWAESENRWLAIASILQGIGTLLTIGLLIWHLIGNQERHRENRFERLVINLTDEEPLKRLIAVRQLTHLVNKRQLNPHHEQQLFEYFQLMLSRETDGAIKEAVLQSLGGWKKTALLSQ